MAGSRRRPVALGLTEVQGHFRSWRLVRKKGARIPARLWEEARGLHPRHSIYAISRALRLDYVDVRKRIGANKGRGWEARGRQPGPVRFVTLPAVAGPLIGECRIVSADSAEGGLRAELRNVGARELAALIGELRSLGL